MTYQNMLFGWIFVMWYVFVNEISGISDYCVCLRSEMLQEINIEKNIIFFWALETFALVSFNKFLAGKILNNFCSSWINMIMIIGSCYNMIISFITKIAFLLSPLINKMCTILTNLPDIWVLFGIPFLIRLLVNQHLLLLHFQILLKVFYQSDPLFVIIMSLHTALTTILLLDYHQATDIYILIHLHCIILILCDVLMLDVIYLSLY